MAMPGLAPGAGVPRPSMAQPSPTPPAAPAQPLAQEGLRTRARLAVILARKVLEENLPHLDAESDEGKAVLKALTALSAVSAGAPDPRLMESEAAALKNAAQPAPTPVGGAGVSPAGPPMGGAMGGPQPGMVGM